MPNEQTHEEPRWMRVARAVYTDHFDGRSRDEVLNAMDEWGEDGEELFILAHLGFLNLSASRDVLFANHDLLDGIGELIEEQKKTRELLAKLGRFLKHELGELADLLDEGEGDQEEEETEPATVLSPGSELAPKPEVLSHPIPEEDQ